MSKSIVVCIKLILSLNATMIVPAQQNSSLSERIITAVDKKGPGCKFQKKRETSSNGYVTYSWKCKSAWVRVITRGYASSAEAAGAFDTMAYDLQVHGLNMRVIGKDVQSLGDEHYLWEEPSNEKLKGIYFRKNNMVINVMAPSIETARVFARLIANEISVS